MPGRSRRALRRRWGCLVDAAEGEAADAGGQHDRDRRTDRHQDGAPRATPPVRRRGRVGRVGAVVLCVLLGVLLRVTVDGVVAVALVRRGGAVAVAARRGRRGRRCGRAVREQLLGVVLPLPLRLGLRLRLGRGPALRLVLRRAGLVHEDSLCSVAPIQHPQPVRML